MSADLAFLDEIIQGLEPSDLEWAKARINRRLAAHNPGITMRRAIIRQE